jgi:cytochrome d ubiquinol oxidase subunit I
MEDLLAARLTMAMSLGFHIILAAFGMVLPVLMATAHRRWLRTGDPQAYRLTRAWTRGAAVFFAVGAVSGTALSFELGMLWPGFMEHAGPIIGMPFSLEGLAFFLEAIFLGLYLYGWGRMAPKLHWLCGVGVGISGIMSGLLVVSANGWMNSPTGFDWVDGQALNIDPIAALFNDAWLNQASHMLLAAVEAVGFSVAGAHAWMKWRGSTDPIHGMAIRIALTLGAVAALAQPINGHMAAQGVAERQPTKLAAMEALFESGTQAPLLLGGIPNEETGEVSFALEIPGGLSFLAFGDTDAYVQGLDVVPKDERPPVLITHLAFQIMVGIGTMLAALGALSLWAMRWRPQLLESPRVLALLALVGPTGFIALEAGWVVTEVGRQPWIIHGIMKTADAVTPVPGQVIHLILFAILYTVIGSCTALLWRRQVQLLPELGGPPPELEAWRVGAR